MAALQRRDEQVANEAATTNADQQANQAQDQNGYPYVPIDYYGNRPTGNSWVNGYTYDRANVEYLCSQGYTQYCGSGVNPYNKPPCYAAPAYCQNYNYFNNNPTDFWSAVRFDPATGQQFNGGIQTCNYDADGNKQCVA